MIDAAQYSHRLLESEFTFKFRRQLQPTLRGYSRTEVFSSIDAVIRSLELINPRFTSLTVTNIPQVVADFCANGGAVLGRECREWQSLDLSALSARLLLDGQERQRGTGALVLGDPINVLEWFANKVTREGMYIEAGQFVMTGTMTGLHAPSVGSTATAQFDCLGDVSIAFQ